MILDGGISYEDFKGLLARNQKALWQYIDENSRLDTIESWVKKKSKNIKIKTKKSQRVWSRLRDWKVNIFDWDFGIVWPFLMV